MAIDQDLLVSHFPGLEWMNDGDSAWTDVPREKSSNPSSSQPQEREHLTFATLTLNPSPRWGEGLGSCSPPGRRGWGMRGF